MDIMNYGLREKYEQLKKFGDRLSDMKDIIDWDRIKPLLSDLYRNDTEKGGRPVNAGQDLCKIAGIELIHPI